jgi:hypothetical protein
LYHLAAEHFHTSLDDPRIVEMDPVHRIFLYNHWIQTQNDKNELAKNHAYLVGSIINPEMGKLLSEQQDIIEVDDEQFEQSWDFLKEQQAELDNKKIEKDPVKKKRKVKRK